MPSAKFAAWRKERGSPANQELRKCVGCLFLALLLSLVVLITSVFSWPFMLCGSEKNVALTVDTQTRQKYPQKETHTFREFDCVGSLQAAPVIAHKVEGTRYPFFISLADLGTPEKPNRNFQRILKGKFFRRPDISETVQSVLEKLNASGKAMEGSLVVDVGANVGMATFAAAVMGYRVLAFEAVFENLQKLCDGVYLNRVPSSVELYHAAVSDVPGNITMHKVVGRLDNSAVSASGAKLAFKSNEVVPIIVQAVKLDSVLPPSRPVLLLKIDVQGWEYHVLKGATKLLSSPPGKAPYIIYENDERLLQESKSSSQEILQFLRKHGYKSCMKIGGDQHCTK